MNHVISPQFAVLVKNLPARTRKELDHAFSVLKEYPNHPLLRLVKVEGHWSMRIGGTFRAVAVEHNGTIIWYWIGRYHHFTARYQ